MQWVSFLLTLTASCSQKSNKEMWMKRLVAICALGAGLACEPALADELSQATAAWQTHDFATALQLYTKLAQQGQPEAERLLGEMYGYGDGVPEDRAVAEQWIKRAQAAGDAGAAQSLANLEARARRRDDIAFYTARYDGADVRLQKFNCVKPDVPERTETRDATRKVDRAINDWLACYKRFSDNLAAQLPVGKAIPPDLADLMSMAEISAAQKRLSDSYRAAAAEGKAQADALLAARATWVAKTSAYVEQEHLESMNEMRTLPPAQMNPPPVPVGHH
jgi:TPR repeat protein